MASIQATARNQLVFIQSEGAEPQLLLDCSRPISNRSQLPLFPARNDPRPSLLQLTAGYMEQCRQDAACQPHQLGFSLLLCLLANELQRTAGPARVLEYGCGNGELSPFLAGLLGGFDQKSALYCLSDSLSPQWAERMAQVSQGPQIKYLVSRYGDSGLGEANFDAVLLNGSRPFRDPQTLLEEALELLTDDGVLLCYTDADPLPDILLALYFDRCERFPLDAQRQITVVRKTDLSWQISTPHSVAAHMDMLLDKTQTWLDSGTDMAQGAALDRQLDRAADEAVSLDDRRRKQKLLDTREALLNKLLDA